MDLGLRARTQRVIQSFVDARSDPASVDWFKRGLAREDKEEREFNLGKRRQQALEFHVFGCVSTWTRRVG